jgi:hypothetical protein
MPARLFGWTCALFILLAAPSQASIVNIDFTGTVLTATGVTSSQFAAGDSVSGSLVYDDAGGVDQFPGELRGLYAPPPILSHIVQIGSYTAIGDPLASNAEIWVQDDLATMPVLDSYVFRTGATGDSVGGAAPVLLQFSILTLGTDRSGDPIPTAAEILSFHFLTPQFTQFLLFGPPGTPNRVDWRADTISVTPEPGTALLVGFGLAVLAGRARLGRERRR